MRSVRRFVWASLATAGLAGAAAACGGAPSPEVKTAHAANVAKPATDPLAPDPTVADLTLPVARSSAVATPSSLRVYLTRKALSVGSPPTLVASLPTDAEAQKHGFDASLKRNGQNDLFLVPLAAQLSRLPPSRSALVFVDQGTPYRTLIEVLFTLGQSEITDYDLVTKTPEGTLGAIRVTPPRATAANASDLMSPRLTVMMVNDGMAIKAHGGNVAPGCNDTGAGLAIPTSSKGGAPAQDFLALTACLTRLKTEVPELAASDAIVVTASPTMKTELVLQAVAAAATSADGRSLYPRAMFGISR